MAPEPLTPDWFRDKLYERLRKQQDEFAFFDAYYTGNHPLPFVTPQARDEFRRIIKMTRSNVMGLVCDATAERENLEGFQLGDDEAADRESWRIWEANGLDSDSDMAWLESLIGGRSYFLVGPDPKNARTPRIWVEHQSQCVVAYEPGTNRRVRKAGLKVWADEWTDELHATLYLMDQARLWLFKYRTDKPKTDHRNLVWERRAVSGEDWPADGQLDVLPLIEAPNNPRLLPGGVSELYDVTDIQDRINKTLFDRMQTQEFGVDPQKWAKAFPNEDDDGKPNVVEFGRNRMITTDIAETGFGNFAVAPLAPYLEAKREDVKDIASRTRTPAQYLLGEMSNVNGEPLKASASGLISKVKQRRKPHGQAATEAMRVAHLIAGRVIPPGAISAMWNDPQYRTDGERTDAALKRFQAGIVPLRQTRVDLGYSQTQITDMERADRAELIPRFSDAGGGA
jgi:Phage portal protein, SPP1 Gp6-like